MPRKMLGQPLLYGHLHLISEFSTTMSSDSTNPTVGLNLSQLAEVGDEEWQLLRKGARLVMVPEFVIPNRNRWTPGVGRGSGGTRKLRPKVML